MARLPSSFSNPMNVAVLYGGPSAEREVSLESGREVAAALERRGHCVTRIDPGPISLDSETFYRLADWRRFDVAFLALHGTFGEDGSLQRLLDDLGLPYTGSGAFASRLAFSKSAAKERFAAEAIATPTYLLAHECDPRGRLTRYAATLGFPLVVKPDAQGSSLGVSIVGSPDELPAALEHCFAFGSFAILERYIAGTEWTVGFLGAQPLPAMCVSTPRAFLDFEAKYRDEATVVTFDEDASPSVGNAVTEIASRACRALGVSGVCRVDLRVDSQHHPWVLEVNTLPGFTPHSAVPTAAARVGIDFDELCEQSLALALSHHAGRRAA
jgi:D-alanine-D-alanine ligase